VTLVVVGSGRLARAVCYSLGAMAHRLPDDARVVVVGRRPEPVAELCYVASARAALAAESPDGPGGPDGPGRSRGAGAAVRFEPVVVDVADEAAVAEVLGAAEPAGVLLCASTQSPWERMTAPSAWTALVERARFGVTLPFQAEQAVRVASAVPDGAWFLNACFPDAVNPVLAALDVPVLAGVGNIGLLAASAQSALGLPDQRRLRMVAHHLHLYEPDRAEEEAMAWLDDEPLTGVGALLAAQRASARDELNHVTGHTAAVLVAALLTGSDLDTNLPGPLGLPGGYPVRVHGVPLRVTPRVAPRRLASVSPLSGPRNDNTDASGRRGASRRGASGRGASRRGASAGRVELRLPAGISLDDAVARNQRWALADGALVDGGRVTFGDAARAELAAVAPELADGFDATDLTTVAERMHGLRDQLRARPTGR